MCILVDAYCILQETHFIFFTPPFGSLCITVVTFSEKGNYLADIKRHTISLSIAGPISAARDLGRPIIGMPDAATQTDLSDRAGAKGLRKLEHHSRIRPAMLRGMMRLLGYFTEVIAVDRME